MTAEATIQQHINDNAIVLYMFIFFGVRFAKIMQSQKFLADNYMPIGLETS